MWGARAAPGMAAARMGCRAQERASANRASMGRRARPATTAAMASTVTRVPLSCDHLLCEWRLLLTCCVPVECRCQHGLCRDGVDGDGTCECHLGWRGVLCDQSRSTNTNTHTHQTYTNTHAQTHTPMNTHGRTHTCPHIYVRTRTRIGLMHLGHVTIVTSVLVIQKSSLTTCAPPSSVIPVQSKSGRWLRRSLLDGAELTHTLRCWFCGLI